MQEPGWNTVLIILQIVALLFAGGMVFYRLGGIAQQFKIHSQEISDLKITVQKTAELITEMAIQTTRMDAMAQRLNLVEKWYDELRRGIGFIDARRP